MKTLSFWTNKVFIWWLFNDNFRARERKEKGTTNSYSIFFLDHNGRRTNWGHSWNKHGTNGCYVSSKYSKNFSKTYVMFTDPIAVRIFSFKFINDLHMKQVCLYVYGTIEILWNDAPKKTLTLASRELKTDFDLNTTFFHSK